MFSKLLRYYETAYAAVISRQEAFFDNEMPMEVLGHNPWEDPLEAIFDRILKKGDFNLQDEAKNTQIQQLKEKVSKTTRLAAYHKQIWHQTKGIETIPHIYRIRVGIHHRLIIQWEKEKGLKVLDLIPRAQLETWIRQRAM